MTRSKIPRVEKDFPQVHAGEWVQPIRKGYLMQCCDCGLVHKLDFRLVKNGRGNFIQMRAFRVNRPQRRKK